MHTCDLKAHSGNPRHVSIREIWHLAAIYQWAVQRQRMVRRETDHFHHLLRHAYCSAYDRIAWKRYFYEMRILQERLSGVISWTKAVASMRFRGAILRQVDITQDDIERAEGRLRLDREWYKRFDKPEAPALRVEEEDFDPVDYVLRYRLPSWLDTLIEDMPSYFSRYATREEQCPSHRDLYLLFFMAIRFFFIQAHQAGASIEFKYPAYNLLTELATRENLIHDRRYRADEVMMRVAAHLLYDYDEELFREFTRLGIFPFGELAPQLKEENT